MRNGWNRGWNRGPRGLLGRFGLLIGIRVAIAVLGIAVVVIGSVFTGLAAVFSGVIGAIGSVFSEVFAGSTVMAGVAVGTAIGLIAYRMIRAKKEETTVRDEEKKKEKAETTGTGFVETPHYRFYA